jgi:PAS domain S-box-containing protein
MAQTPSLSILRQLIEGTESVSSKPATAAPPSEEPSASPTTSVAAQKPEEKIMPEEKAAPAPADKPVAVEKEAATPPAPTVVPTPSPAPEVVPLSKPAAAAPVSKSASVPANTYLKILAENAPVAMAIFDSAMKYLYANQRWLEFFKLEQSEVVGRSQYEVFPSLHPGWRHVYERALSGQVVRSDRDTVNQAGRPVLYRWEVRPWRNADTSVGGLMITCLSIPGVQSKDVADNAAPAASVPAAESNSGLWDLPMPMMALDAEGKVSRWSSATAALMPTGALQEGQTFFWDLFPGSGDTTPLRSATLHAVHRAAAGDLDLAPLMVHGGSGENASALPSHWQVVALPSSRESTAAVVLLIGLRQPPAPPPAPAPVAVSSETEKILRQREARLRSVLDAAPCGLLVLDERGTPVFHNGRAASLLGRYMSEGQSVEDWLSTSCRDEQHREEVVRLWREQVWRKQVPKTLTLSAADGVLREIELRPAAVPGGGVLVLLNDVTEERRSEELLRATEAKFRTLVHENPLPIVLADRSGMVFEANAAAETLTGRTRAELRRMAMEEWLAPESHATRQGALQEMNQRGDLATDLEVTLNHREGHPVPSSLRMAAVPDGFGQSAGTIHFFKPVPPPPSVFLDEGGQVEISESPEVESFLTLPSSIILLGTDYHGRVVEWSEEAEMCFGLTEEEAAGRGLHTLFRPSDASGFYSDLAAITEHGLTQPVEWMFLHPQHGRRTGRFVLQPLEVGGMAVSILSEEQEEEAAEEEEDFLAEEAPEETITAHAKLAEISAEDAARRLERERFLVGETHHRVKNHLQIITSMLNLQLSMIHNDEAREALRSSQNRVRSIAELHQHLFSLAVGEGGNFAEFAQELIAHLRDCYDMSEDRVTVEMNLSEVPVPEEWLMPLSLSLNEMVSNAFKHAFPEERKGSLQIELRRDEDSVEMLVKDDGVGMPEDFEHRHFSGLGMRILRVFAGQLGGEVRITSEPDHGSTFCLHFPKTQ